MSDNNLMVKNCVYFITDGEYIKVGIASELDRRLKQLQTGNARPLVVIAVIKCRNMDEARDLESTLHRSLRNINVMNEWFLGDMQTIKAAVAKTGMKLDYISAIPYTVKKEYAGYISVNFFKELIEILGAMTLGGFIVHKAIPLLSDLLIFLSDNPILLGFIVGGAAVVVLFDIVRRRRLY